MHAEKTADDDTGREDRVSGRQTLLRPSPLAVTVYYKRRLLDETRHKRQWTGVCIIIIIVVIRYCQLSEGRGFGGRMLGTVGNWRTGTMGGRLSAIKKKNKISFRKNRGSYNTYR